MTLPKKSKDCIKRVNIIGVPISVVNMSSCIKSISGNLENIRGEYICVSNVHTTVMAHEDPDYYKVQAESYMSIPDGKPLSIVGKKTFPEMDRVTGPDLMRNIFQISASHHYKHFFYGNTKENLNRLIDQIEIDYPWLDVVGYEASIFRELNQQEECELVERINRTSPDFIWIAIGAPRQEKLCYRLRGKTKGLMIGVGGAFNILAGIVPEAPVWMQNLSLEWLYRLFCEPKRLFKRYAVTNTKFLWYLFTGNVRKK